MLVEFSVFPMDDTHISDELARVVSVLEDLDVDFRLNPTSTSLSGEWDEVMRAIRLCHETVAESGHARVVTHVTIDDRRGSPISLKEAVEHVERNLGHRTKT